VSTPPLRTRRWNRVEYEQLVDEGFFRPDALLP
jgi:hypothetical protein